MLALLTLLLTSPARAERLDIHRCNNLAGHAGVAILPSKNDRAHYRLDEQGNLKFDHDHPHTLLLEGNGRELTYWAYADRSDVRVGDGLGAEGVVKSHVKLSKEKGKPATLETTETFYALDGNQGWARIRKALKGSPPKKNERTRVTESWIRYGFSGDRCYVAQEGIHKLVSFDQLLCNQVLQITERNADDVLLDFRSGPVPAKREANRVLRLIRDAQIARDEHLKGEGKRLLAVTDLPQHQLPGTIPAEDSSALEELRGCIAAQVRNGLRRPEAASKENTDFMGNEPQPDVDEPPASGNP